MPGIRGWMGAGAAMPGKIVDALKAYPCINPSSTGSYSIQLPSLLNFGSYQTTEWMLNS